MYAQEAHKKLKVEIERQTFSFYALSIERLKASPSCVVRRQFFFAGRPLLFTSELNTSMWSGVRIGYLTTYSFAICSNPRRFILIGLGTLPWDESYSLHFKYILRSRRNTCTKRAQTLECNSGIFSGKRIFVKLVQTHDLSSRKCM